MIATIGAFLILFTINSTGGRWVETGRYSFHTMEECTSAVGKSDVRIPLGGDAEAAIVLVCVPNIE